MGLRPPQREAMTARSLHKLTAAKVNPTIDGGSEP
jgi:hypothetical protein